MPRFGIFKNKTIFIIFVVLSRHARHPGYAGTLVYVTKGYPLPKSLDLFSLDIHLTSNAWSTCHVHIPNFAQMDLPYLPNFLLIVYKN